MNWWVKLTDSIFKGIVQRYLHSVEPESPDLILKRATSLLDHQATGLIKDYVKGQFTPAGGFADKAGNPDLYYTVFGCFLAEALDIMEEVVPVVRSFLTCQLASKELTPVHLHCAAILSAKCEIPSAFPQAFRNTLMKEMRSNKAYMAFLGLLTYYYTNDYAGIYRMRKQLTSLKRQTPLPCPVNAAILVLQHTFGKPVESLQQEILRCYSGHGSFRAFREAPLPDLLSTGVALYALHYSGYDLRQIRPDCLEYVDSLFDGGGFMANSLDRDPDIEYTFYGLLALGSLA
jgi:prenyltransferase beta subunit